LRAYLFLYLKKIKILIFGLLEIILLLFLDYFDDGNINVLKKYYFNIFLNKKYFKK
jgi:hypothetical protein